MLAVVIATLVLTILSLLIFGALVAQRVRLSRADAEHTALVEQLTPRLVSFIVLGEGEPPQLAATSQPAHRAATEIVTGYARMLRGDAHERIRTWLTESGALATARADLGSRSTTHRRVAAHLLGAFGTEGDAHRLWRLLSDDPELPVRLTALTSLAELDFPWVRERLIDLPDDLPVPELMVVDTLRRLADRDLRPLAAACRRGRPLRRELACRACATVGTLDHAPLAQALRSAAALDQPVNVRGAALHALGVIGGDTGQILAALGEDEPVILAGALRGAQALATPELADAAQRLFDSQPPVRALAAAAYVSCGGPRRDTPELLEAVDLAHETATR